MLLDKLETRAAHLRRHDDFTGLPSYTYAESLNKIARPYEPLEGYTIELKVESSFWCLGPAYQEAKRNARRGLCRFLYHDLEFKLDQVRDSIWNHQKDKALKIMGEIQTLINGGEVG